MHTALPGDMLHGTGELTKYFLYGGPVWCTMIPTSGDQGPDSVGHCPGFWRENHLTHVFNS